MGILDKARTLGIKPGDVRRAAATLLSGLGVGALFQEQKVFDVVVWGMPAKRDSLTDIHQLLIDTPSGKQVRLDEVAARNLARLASTLREAVLAGALGLCVYLTLVRVFRDQARRIKATNAPKWTGRRDGHDKSIAETPPSTNRLAP